MDQTVRGVLSIARGVLGDLDLDVVLGRVLEAARELTGARYAALGVLDEAREELDQFLTVGVDEDVRHQIGTLPRGRGVLGELIRKPVPLRLTDVGRHPHSYGFPTAHPPMASFLGVPIMIDGEPYGNLYLTDKQTAAEFTQEDEDAVVVLAEFAGVAIDHARRYTGAEEARVELERSVAAFEATVEIARALGGETDLTAILELVAKRGRALIAARALVIELLQDGRLVVAAGAGEVPEGMIGSGIDLQDTVAGAALRTRQTQRLSDELNRSRYDQHGAGHLGLTAKDALIVPLIFRNEVYGALVAVDRLGREGTGKFSREHARLLEAFAASAAIGVATARSAASARRRQAMAAAEAERARWARELHDETLQGLANLRLVLSAAQRSGKPDLMAQAIIDAVAQLDTDIAALRALITDLRPAALDQLGADAAIEAWADRLRRTGLDIDVSVDLAFEQGRHDERLVPEIETALYRIVQEALTNATKHGGAERAVVDVSEDSGHIHVLVRDDGSGFDLARRTDGFGLLGMRERVELLDGALNVDSEPGKGTTISAQLPALHRNDIAGAASAMLVRRQRG
jgi:signal transduction histidine kinase